MEKEKYKVENPASLYSWKDIAKKEIHRWLTDEAYSEEVTRTRLSKDENPPGPFTKFLYHFAWLCECGWGVMIDFNEYRQRIYLVDRYYKWMHTLRDEILADLERIESASEQTGT